MIVGVGHHPKFVLDAVRSLRFKDLYVFPEFYDNLRKITAYPAGRFDYAREVWLRRGEVVIAVWPDYMHVCTLPEDVVYVYPLHKREEVDFVLGKLDSKYEFFLGFPNRDEFRDYGIQWFRDLARTYGLKTWLLGLKPRWVPYLWMFDAADVTTMSLRGKSFSDIRRSGTVREYLNLIRNLIEGRVPHHLRGD